MYEPVLATAGINTAVEMSSITMTARSKQYNYCKVVNISESSTVLNELVLLAIEGSIRGLNGVHNFTNPSVISHDEVFQLYRDHCDGNFTW